MTARDGSARAVRRDAVRMLEDGKSDGKHVCTVTLVDGTVLVVEDTAEEILRQLESN